MTRSFEHFAPSSCILLVAIQCRVSINSNIIPLRIAIAEYFRDMGYNVNMMA
jgi:vacuolar-type H+-ATPase catalytic subunit A/Vma1